MAGFRFRAALALVVIAAGALSARAQAPAATGAEPAPAPTPTPTSAPAAANAHNFAPGFSVRGAGSRLVLVPADMELFSMSAGGVTEPRADWTAAAQQHFRAAVLQQKVLAGAATHELAERDVDEFAQLNALHGAVAEAVFVHHVRRLPALPTKGDALDWTLGDAVQPLRARTGADYALFFWLRDSYASAERKAAMVALALLGVVATGGVQVGYASLVDLRSGRIVWFNSLLRLQGDLREAEPARETVEALLRGFPAAQ